MPEKLDTRPAERLRAALGCCRSRRRGPSVRWGFGAPEALSRAIHAAFALRSRWPPKLAPMNRVRMILAGAALAAIAIVGSPVATAGAQSAAPAGDELPFYDLRGAEAPAAAAAPAGVRSAWARLRSALGDEARLDVDPVTGTARSIERLGGTLTRPAAGGRRDIAEGWIRGHLDAIGLTADDLGTLAAPERT